MATWWVGGWVDWVDWVEENEAVGMSCWTFYGKVGGWVGGWVTLASVIHPIMTGVASSVRLPTICLVKRRDMSMDWRRSMSFNLE